MFEDSGGYEAFARVLAEALAQRVRAVWLCAQFLRSLEAAIWFALPTRGSAA